MTKMMTLPVASVPSAIADGLAAAVNAHGLSLSPDLLNEISSKTATALLALDESMAHDAEPSMSDRLAVGETLRALALMGRPNPETAKALERVGSWLSRTARAELVKGGKAA